MFSIRPAREMTTLSRSIIKLRTWTQLNTQWLSRAKNGIANSNTGRLFVNLNGSLVRIDPDNLFAFLSIQTRAHGAQMYCTPPTSSSCPTRTSSYMAEPVMFSAMTTGPDTPKTCPKRDSRSSSRTLGRSLFAFCSAPAIVVDVGGRRFGVVRVVVVAEAAPAPMMKT